MPDRRGARSRAPLRLGLVSGVAAAILVAVAAAPLAAQQVRRPAEVLGYDPVATARLPAWREMLDFFETLAAESPRVRLDTIGRSTLDAPLVMATVSSEENLARLDELREVQARLADPRRIGSDAARDSLLDRGRLVVLLTAGTHSTEVGGPLAAMRLAWQVATLPTPRAERIRNEVILLVVPAVNPDGIDPVKEWYESTRGTPWLGSEPPFLYHHYVGHDLNRDWYAFTQKETRAIVERVLQRWHPQIHHDLHQQQSTGVRYFIPPWLDPVEPNVDPLLTAAATSLGTRVQWSLLEEGRTGVAVAALYDAWSPARSYVHYHAGVRMLSETASARLAAPIDVAPDDLEPGLNVDPRVPSWNHPVPWPGGRWDLTDVVGYMQSGAMALLGIAAGERRTWLRSFERVGRRAVDGWDAWPESWVIPPPDRDGPVPLGRSGVAELVRILRTAGVEVHHATEPFTAEGRSFAAGSYVVGMHQPYAAFAQAMLARRPYPAPRRYEGEPPAAPYDATAHNLPLLLGVRAIPVHEAPPAAGLEPVSAPPAGPPRRVEGLSAEPAVMVGLYRPWVPSPDEGWTRWVFDTYAVPYVPMTNDDLARAGSFRDLTAFLLPSVEPAVLRAGRSAADVPPEYAGGLGAEQLANLQEFVSDGGTLVAMGASVDFVIDALELPVENFLAGLSRADFYAPGSQVGLTVDTTTRVGADMPARTAGWLEEGAAFRARGAGALRVVARYASEPVVRSGLVVGGSWIAGRPAVVELDHGAGRVVLFGIRPQYRGQSLATYPLLFNALKRRR
jgi:hypothetical protein